MPEQKEKNKNIRKLIKISKSSFSVTLPIEYINKLRWKEHQKLCVSLKGPKDCPKIIIQDWPKNK